MTHDIRPSARAENYLAELERAAAALPPHRRAELLADVRGHIAVAQAEFGAGGPDGTDDDAAMRTILGRLGDPHDIVTAALSDLPPAPAPLPAPPAPLPAPPVGSGGREAAAIILLIIGGALFWELLLFSQICWIVGLVLMCLSRRWTVGDKLLGFAGIALTPVVLTGSVFLSATAETCDDSSVAQAPQPGSTVDGDTSSTLCTTSSSMPDALVAGLLIFLLAVLIFSTIRLALRARRR